MDCKECKITNDGQFINEVCSKCKNKQNTQDLCSIVIRIDGVPDCCNKNLVEANIGA